MKSAFDHATLLSGVRNDIEYASLFIFYYHFNPLEVPIKPPQRIHYSKNAAGSTVRTE